MEKKPIEASELIDSDLLNKQIERAKARVDEFVTYYLAWRLRKLKKEPRRRRYTFYLLDFSLGLFYFMLLSIGYHGRQYWVQIANLTGRSLVGIEHNPKHSTVIHLLYCEFTIWRNLNHDDFKRFRGADD